MPLSVLQFGLHVNDAFGVATLLETLFESAVLTFAIDILFSIAKDGAGGIPWWVWIFLLILLIKPLIFFGVILYGYIWEGRKWTLKLWVILGTTLDLTLPILVIIGGWIRTEEEQVEDDSISAMSIVFFLMYLLTIVIFRAYVYLVMWLGWRELKQGFDLRGYGLGLFHLVQYYREEFMRVACILLLVDFIWNSSLTMALDLPLEIDKQIPHLNDTGKLLFRPIIPLRLSRLLLSSIGIFLIKKEKSWLLKYIWFPCQLSWTFLGLLMLIFITWYAEDPLHHVYHVSVYCTETILYFSLNTILVYCVWKIIRHSPLTPVPLVQRSNSNSMAVKPIEDYHSHI